MITVQRSTFTLSTGINRPGDPADEIVPSAPRLLPKGADNAGAQVLVSFTDLGDYQFEVLLEGTNQPSVADPGQPDPNASWIPIDQTSAFSDGSTDLARMVNPPSQVTMLAPFLFVRATLQTDEGVVSDADNLDVSVFVKTDYQTG